jgi:hypothetical protein
MYSDDDMQYALEATEILYEPDRRIDTFGSTAFEFHLVTELMDDVNKVRVRSGRITAERPLILKPDLGDNFELDGFSEKAAAFMAWLRENIQDLRALRYAFTLKKSDVSEQLTADTLPNVCESVVRRVRESGSPMTVVLQGVDDAWEICLLKFTFDMIQKSQRINWFDFKRRGLLD